MEHRYHKPLKIFLVSFYGRLGAVPRLPTPPTKGERFCARIDASSAPFLRAYAIAIIRAAASTLETASAIRILDVSVPFEAFDRVLGSGNRAFPVRFVALLRQTRVAFVRFGVAGIRRLSSKRPVLPA